MGLEWRMAILSGLDLNTRPELGLVWFRHGYFVLCGVYLFAVTARNYARVTNAAMRLRVQWVILGGMVGIVPGVFGSVALAAADLLAVTSPRGRCELR